MLHVNLLGKNRRKSEPSADFMRVGLFPFFTFLASLECSYAILPQPCALLHIETLIEAWLLVPWGPGIL